jgi:hypothetical protein
MRKLTLVLITVAFSFALFAQSHVPLSSQKTNSEIKQNTTEKIVFTSNLEEFELTEAKTLEGLYSRIIVPEYYPNNKVGYPELPVMTKLIEVPYNSEFEISIISYDEQIIDLNEFGSELPLVPNQTPLFKNQDPYSAPENKFQGPLPFPLWTAD